jgi:hypothetical protein
MAKTLLIDDPISLKELLDSARFAREQADVIRAGTAEQQSLGLGAPKQQLDSEEQLAVDAALALRLYVAGYAPVQLAPQVTLLNDFEWMDGPKKLPEAFVLPAKLITNSEQPWRFENHYREVIRGPLMFLGLRKLVLRLPYAGSDIIAAKREISRHVPEAALYVACWANRLPITSPDCVLLCKAGDRYFKIASWK